MPREIMGASKRGDGVAPLSFLQIFTVSVLARGGRLWGTGGAAALSCADGRNLLPQVAIRTRFRRWGSFRPSPRFGASPSGREVPGRPRCFGDGILRRSAPQRWRGYASAPFGILWYRFPFSVAQMANTNGFSCFCSAFGRTTKKPRFYRPPVEKPWKSTKNAFVTLHKGIKKRRKREENGAFES